MKLLLLTTEFPNPYDPTKAVFNLDLASALARQHEIKVVSPVSWINDVRSSTGSGGLHGRERTRYVEGIEVLHPRHYYVPRFLRSQSGRFFWWSIRGTIRRLLKRFTPDAVLGYWAYPDGEAAVRTARLAGATAGVIVGGSDILLVGKSPSRRRQIQSVLQSTDLVFTVGQHLRQAVLEYGIDSHKVVAWSRGVDQGRFAQGDRVQSRRRLGISEQGQMLLWAGRMVPVKAVDVLLRACAEVRERGCPFHLYLVGDGELRKSLASQTDALRLSESVTFVGSLPHGQLADWFRAADVTVLPSLSEGMPNVLRESLACGTRFIASRVGGIGEMAVEPYDRLVPPNDTGALADAIIQKLANPIEPPSVGVRGLTEQSNELVERLRNHVRPETPGHNNRSMILPALSCR